MSKVMSENDYLRAKIVNHFNNKFPRTFHSIDTWRDHARFCTRLAIKFTNGRVVQVDDIEDYDSGAVRARCIMIHDLTDPLPQVENKT